MSMTQQTEVEFVVLLDDDGRPVGRAEKSTVHHVETPLHLGFSCYLFDGRGNVLFTRRALTKVTWPGVWTNSFCGHPAPGEDVTDAVHRRASRELGVDVDDLQCALPDFRYRATAADGTVENEICPVFVARTASAVDPAPDETMDARWVPWRQARAAATLDWAISPWAVTQIPLLDAYFSKGSGPRFVTE